MSRKGHFTEGAAPHFRNARATPTSSIAGVEHVPHAELPHEVVGYHAALSTDNDKHGDAWTYSDTETVHPSTVIKTGQAYVGQEHVESYASRLRGGKGTVSFKDKDAQPEDQDNGQPRLLRHNGELWHVDGLHRVAAARTAGRPFRARVWDADKWGHPYPEDD